LNKDTQECDSPPRIHTT